MIFAVADSVRFTGDQVLLDELWPRVQLAVQHREQLRATRLTDAYRAPEHRACFGLLPESVSHEGYLAQPVHAYWDDFWALRGFKDAASLAEMRGNPGESARLAALADDFRSTLMRAARPKPEMFCHPWRGSHGSGNAALKGRDKNCDLSPWRNSRDRPRFLVLPQEKQETAVGLGQKPDHCAICTVVGPHSGHYGSRCYRKVRCADRPPPAETMIKALRSAPGMQSPVIPGRVKTAGHGIQVLARSENILCRR